MSLKDNGIPLHNLYSGDDVKEAVLELRRELRSIESCIERNKFLALHTKIFGDFSEEDN